MFRMIQAAYVFLIPEQVLSLVLPDSICIIKSTFWLIIKSMFWLRIPNLFLKIKNVETHKRADEWALGSCRLVSLSCWKSYAAEKTKIYTYMYINAGENYRGH